MADDDEARRDADTPFFPSMKCFFVVAVEGLEGRLQSGRQFKWVVFLTVRATFFGHVFADVFPQVAEHRHLVARDIFGNRNAGQLHNPTFDGIHE